MTNLSNQVYVNSVSTDAFFNEGENAIAQTLMNIRVEKKELFLIKEGKYSQNKDLNDSIKKKVEAIAKEKSETVEEVCESIILDFEIKEAELGRELNDILEKNKEIDRSLRRDALYTYSKTAGKEINKSSKVVSLFESSFTRALQLDSENVNESVVIVKGFHYIVLENLIKKGFKYNNEEYKFFSSSSGQMKNKKCVFVKKSLLETELVNANGEKYTIEDRLMCGLSVDRINNTVFKKGDKEERGININKFLAYLSLQNTATTKWEDFDINKVVVCPDLEIDVTDKVEFIDRDTYKISKPEDKTLPMNVSDGVGLILPKMSKKNFQFRINWGKGLLSPWDFQAQAKKLGKYEITDVWGKTHHIINDDVQIILSASQLKTWKYYDSMNEYREFFIKFECEAGKCNEEVDTKDIHLNYQFLQTLTDLSPKELTDIAKITNDDIQTIGSSKSVMLRSIGATVENENKNHFQEALLKYENLLNDSHAKEMIKSKKASIVEDAYAGSLRVEGKRMFVLPDLYAYGEFLLTGNKNPKGLIEKNKVFAKNLEEGTIDIMRSPSLYREHGIRENTKNEELEKWFTTGALYCSNKDFLSRLLQMDFDGDCVNVCVNKAFVEAAKRNMKGIYPLYYKMSVAPMQEINSDSIYSSLILAFGGSIGSISNQITKIWSSPGEMTEEKLSTVKLLTMYNNFMIDHCKTNFLPKPKGHAKKLIKKYSKGNMPYFFQWAKGKETFEEKVVKEIEVVVDDEGKVLEENIVSERTPVVNMLEDIIVDKRITFRSVAHKFDYKMLMDMNITESMGEDLDEAITKAYSKINKGKKWLIDKESDDYKENKYTYIAKVIKDQIMKAARAVNENVTDNYVANVLIEFLHTKNNSTKKSLWESFGDIILENLNRNLENSIECLDCGNTVMKVKQRQERCVSCQTKRDKEKQREYTKKSKAKKKLTLTK